MILPIVAITVLSFEQFVNAARTRDVNYTIVIYIFVAALIWIGVAIAFSIVFCISFFRAIASTIEEIERLMGLSTDRKMILLQTFRRFRIVALITIISRIVFSSATGLAAQGQTESATAQMAFGVLQMLVSVGFVLFISIIFRATQSESLDARVNAEWNHTGLNSFDQENEDF